MRQAADRIVEDEAAWSELSGEERYPVVAAYLGCVEPSMLTTWVLLATLRTPEHLQCVDEAWAGDFDADEIASSFAHGDGFDDLAPETVDELTAAALSCVPDEQWWQDDETFLLERSGLPTEQASCVVGAYVEVLGVEAIVRRRILTLDFIPASPEEIDHLDLPARCGADVPVAVVELGVRPGDCVTGFGQGARATVAVDCAQSHNAEVVSVVDLAAAFPQWPGMATLRSEAQRRCGDDVGGLVGSRAGYGAGWDIPDRTAWEASGNTLTCVLIKPGFASWTGPSGLVPTPTTTVVTTTTTAPAPAPVVTNINEVAVGQCFVDDPGLADGDLGDGLVDVVDCSLPHLFEMFHVSSMDGPAGTPYPGDDVARNTAISRCHPAFDAYVGRVWAESRLGFTFVYPAGFEWDANNRRIYCLLWDGLGRMLTSSMAGSGE